MQLDIASADRTDLIFRNMAARVAFDKFIGFVPTSGQTTPLIFVYQTDARMTCLMDDFQRRLTGVLRGEEGQD